MEAILKAMRDYPASASLQQQACATLWDLTVNDSNKVRAVLAGAVDAVVGALAAHAGAPGVQEAGFGALQSLAFHQEAKARDRKRVM